MTTTIRLHRIKKTSMRTKKMRGEETLKGSTSCAMDSRVPANNRLNMA
jgi:hypothetical protein